MLKPFQKTGYVPVKIIRKREGDYIEGKWVPADPTYLEISANVQPLLEKDGTKMLPEGDVSKAGIKIYTEHTLYEKKEGSDNYDADIVCWEGEEYEIRKAIQYSMGILDHKKYIAIQVPRT